MHEMKNAKNREKEKRKKILLFVLFIAVIAIAPLISICIFYFSGHTLVVENTTDSNVRFLVLWSDGKSSDLITLEANDKINLRKAVWSEGNSEIFVNINGVWCHNRVDDYACPNLNTKAVFKIQSPIPVDKETNTKRREI
jgi:hypothetical protein